jgi:hypothetical protein
MGICARHNHVVLISPPCFRQRPERFSQQALDAVTRHGPPDPATDRHAQTRSISTDLAEPAGRRSALRHLTARERVQHQRPARCRATMAVDPVEFGASGQASPLLLGGHQKLDRQARTASTAPALEHRLAGVRPHTRTKPVRTRAFALLGLISPLHELELDQVGVPLPSRPAAAQYRGWSTRHRRPRATRSTASAQAAKRP